MVDRLDPDQRYLHGVAGYQHCERLTPAHRRRTRHQSREATWVLTSYLVANAVVLPLSAWLSRVFGRKNYYMACVALFTLSSFLCSAPGHQRLHSRWIFRHRGGKPGGGSTLQHPHSAGFATLLLRLFSWSDCTRLCRLDFGRGNQEFQATRQTDRRPLS